MTEPRVDRAVVVHADAALLAEATAARLLLALIDAQSLARPVHVGLTGGTVGIATLAAVRSNPLRSGVDWSGVHLWWGDERYLPSGDPDRNETQARATLLDHLDVPSANVHSVPGPDSVESVEGAARAYGAELASHAAPGESAPTFAVLLLGVGPDGHVASLFPGLPGVCVTDRATVPVHGSPKPPPTRVSLTLPAINLARQVWLVAAGSEKAPRIADALAGADPTQVPAAGVRGTERTLWLIDVAAAGTGQGPSRRDEERRWTGSGGLAEPLWDAVDDYLAGRLAPADPALQAAAAASLAAGLPQIQVSPLQGQFLHVLAGAVRARQVLEIGTLGGYSAIWLARALPPDGRLVSLEYSDRHAGVARANLARAGLADRAEVLVGPALETLPTLTRRGYGPFDLVFIDADKPNNAHYLRWAIDLCRPGAIIVVDNVVRHGTVADPTNDSPDVVGTREMIELAAAEPRLTATVLQTVGTKGHDGVLIGRVR